MKRIGLTAILLCCLLGMTSCQKEESVPMASAIPNTAFTFFSSTPTPTQILTPEPTAEPTPITLENGEIDLTQMSSTMVYSYVFNLHIPGTMTPVSKRGFPASAASPFGKT